MADVASRDLRNNTRALLERVEAGESITITVDGRPVATLEPAGRRPASWLATSSSATCSPVVPILLFVRTSATSRPTPPTTFPSGDHRTGRHDRVHRGQSGRSARLDLLPDRLAVSVITVGELRAGVLAANDVTSRDRRLATLTSVLALDPIPIDQAVAETWARLRVSLREFGLRMPVNDSWIAATAMTLGIPVVTQDDGFVHAPGLEVIHI